ncbi:tetratricopeptide repeat protein [Candidatus Odyssella thessalonicensis]|uniref:tetratricopeptide repeat protein n=1 Tax=Candidatus Odyssella thessalonicensis TaxID=84647 RepID=UPI000225A948|nr:tetratricopeptide repeat protein [Candidatus Odyssella thessalonicensis]
MKCLLKFLKFTMYGISLALKLGTAAEAPAENGLLGRELSLSAARDNSFQGGLLGKRAKRLFHDLDQSESGQEKESEQPLASLLTQASRPHSISTPPIKRLRFEEDSPEDDSQEQQSGLPRPSFVQIQTHGQSGDQTSPNPEEDNGLPRPYFPGDASPCESDGEESTSQPLFNSARSPDESDNESLSSQASTHDLSLTVPPAENKAAAFEDVWSRTIQELNQGSIVLISRVLDAIEKGQIPSTALRQIEIESLFFHNPASSAYSSRELFALMTIWESKNMNIPDWFIDEILIRTARPGSFKPNDLYVLGKLYWQGSDLPQDPLKALKLFRAAAHQGSAAAQYNLAKFYMDGRGVARDPYLAIQLLVKAADLDYVPAQRGLKKMFKPAAITLPVPVFPSGPQQLIDHLKHNLHKMREFYRKPPPFSDGDGTCNELGKGYFLQEFSPQLVTSVERHLNFIEHLKMPGFCITALEPRAPHWDSYLVVGSLNGKYYFWSCIKCFEAVMGKPYLLSEQLDEVILFNEEALELFRTNNTLEDVKLILTSLKETAPHLHKYVEDMLKSYFEQVNSKPAALRKTYDGIITFMDDLQTTLLSHFSFVRRLPQQLILILQGTQNYRNARFKQAYPWFFE